MSNLSVTCKLSEENNDNCIIRTLLSLQKYKARACFKPYFVNLQLCVVKKSNKHVKDTPFCGMLTIYLNSLLIYNSASLELAQERKN
jgi:hypothetical protein